MRKKKSQKRIVSKEQYVRVMGQKTSLFAFCGFLSFLAAVSLLIAAFSLFLSVSEHQYWFLGLFAITGSGGLALFYYGRKLFREGRAIERVEPLTDRNSHLLSLQETLVRGSDLPPTVQKAELLRAMQTGQEMPPEELLRSVAGE